MPTHALYLDDSGQKEYAPPGVKYSSGLSRYFVLGGYLTTTREAGRLAEEVRALKLHTFGTTQVEIKSNWLRIPHEREARYLKPFGLTESELRELVDSYYGAVLAADLNLLAAVVDKAHMAEVYPKPWYTPAIAYEAIVQRLQNELSPTGGSAGVVIDDMTGKTPNNSEYKANLTRHHEQLKRTGSALLRIPITVLSGRLKFVNSKDSELIQIADVISYNVFRQFRDYGEEWEQLGLEQLPTYDWFRRMASKFRRGPEGRIQGYGVVKLPLRQRIAWAIPP
jgi:hypothetical protein